MSKIYEIKEYNQEPEADEQFTDAKISTKNSLHQVRKFLNENQIYGKVFEYDADEYMAYYNAGEAESYFLNVPEPTNEWVTDDLIKKPIQEQFMALKGVGKNKVFYVAVVSVETLKKFYIVPNKGLNKNTLLVPNKEICYWSEAELEFDEKSYFNIGLFSILDIKKCRLSLIDNIDDLGKEDKIEIIIVLDNQTQNI
jgi:hypothetical protein